ncbi:glycerophosphodiester phosphodiesterase [Natranaeroarchaeum sulfidigenes]|uniref:Glycerophosphoryl diester phosphodiesterase n=1 Tax=Natranaeroarchaeum sulfidigenes TaxID=2784880 RepID=A0A897MVK0_9EURY|nr:glycerophosphodiester phosphodiesterase family protein [Natranaeroarchaeum sulfidigenes]QSG02186.1 Glycerophosphoryl diester phosphodiesterase [Natranaeroarchaeum sulfidigenes]
MRVIAHRGFAADAPENTVSAIERASRVADSIEFDVRRCGSGELVVVHDERIDRVTDGTGRVADLSLSELQSFDVLGSGESIPTLDDVLAAIATDVDINVELKETAIASDVLDALGRVENDCMVSSFSADALQAVRSHDRPVETAYISRWLRDQPVRRAIELDCEYVHPRFTLLLYSRVLSRPRSVDLEVNVWTVNEPLLARAMAWRGVDGIATDAVEVARPYL